MFQLGGGMMKRPFEDLLRPPKGHFSSSSISDKMSLLYQNHFNLNNDKNNMAVNNDLIQGRFNLTPLKFISPKFGILPFSI